MVKHQWAHLARRGAVGQTYGQNETALSVEKNKTHVIVAIRRHNEFKINKQYRGIVGTIRIFTDYGRSLNK